MSSKKPYDARLRNLKRNKLLTALMSVIVGLVLLLKPSATLSLLSKFIGKSTWRQPSFSPFWACGFSCALQAWSH